jgi:hypothetical protein
MVSGMHVSLLADAVDLVTRVDTTTAATQILLRPDATDEAVASARVEARLMLEDSEEEGLSKNLKLADEALSIAERLRSEQ